MGKFKSKLYKFMYGRYGSDTLGNCMIWSYVIILIVHTVISLFVSNPFVDVAVMLVSGALIIWSFYRMMSRNVVKRRAENQKFCGFWKLRRNKFRDRKTHVYRKCKTCKAVLRLPRAKGKHAVVCPRCKTRFEVRG